MAPAAAITTSIPLIGGAPTEAAIEYPSAAGPIDCGGGGAPGVAAAVEPRALGPGGGGVGIGWKAIFAPGRPCGNIGGQIGVDGAHHKVACMNEITCLHGSYGGCRVGMMDDRELIEVRLR